MTVQDWLLLLKTALQIVSRWLWLHVKGPLGVDSLSITQLIAVWNAFADEKRGKRREASEIRAKSSSL